MGRKEARTSQEACFLGSALVKSVLKLFHAGKQAYKPMTAFSNQ